MLTDFQKYKMKQLFDFWDYDGSGTLERADYEQIAARVAAERGWERGSTQYASTYNAVMSNWAQIEQFADDNNDRVITLNEWLAYCAHLVSDETAYRISAMELMTALLNAVDTDEDGQITLEDYKMWFRIYGAGESDAEAAFAHLDADDDGILSIQEIISAVDDFYHSNAASARGNHMFGPLNKA